MELWTILIVTALGLVIILSSGFNGSINTANLAVGFLLVAVGGIVAFDGRKEDVSYQPSKQGTNEVTESTSTEKKVVDGNHTTVEEEIITRTIKNRNGAVM